MSEPAVAVSKQAQPSGVAAGPTRRWWILGVVGLAQLMVVLDATIVNIALPSAQRALGFSIADRQWVVTAYSLAFGGLLLLGGRLSDLLGRRRMLIIGLVGFAAASALGGASTSFAILVIGRGLQGAFGAILAPAALSTLTVTFTDPAERGRAFGVYGAIAGAGGAVGLLLGGVLTEYLSWRSWRSRARCGCWPPSPVTRTCASTGRAPSWWGPGWWRWSTGCPRPTPRAGGRRPPTRCWPPGWSCWPRSCWPSGASGIRCCRCGSS